MKEYSLRDVMRELAPKVEELSGLKIPKKHGHYVHPKIRMVWKHPYDFYGFYRPRTKTIYIEGTFICNAAHFDLVRAVVAHEYTHYLQDLHWSNKVWNDTERIERHAISVERYWVPPGFEVNEEELIKKTLARRDLY